MNGYRTRDGGTLVNRDKRLSFSFNGVTYRGYEGDTLASALLANGVHLVARSMKYHRPRGILAAGAEDPCALVQLEEGVHGQPNLHATQIALYEGLRARSVNAWPSVNVDVMAVNNLVSPLLVAGFYYKTFMAPRAFWPRLYEPFIRKSAGFGTVPDGPDPDRYDKRHAHCDVLIVGAGPAGLSAALAAASSGARTVLVDENAVPGGRLNDMGLNIGDGSGAGWAAAAAGELADMAHVRLLPRSTMFGYYDSNYLCAVEQVTDHLPLSERPGKVRQRLWHFRARQVVLATGAHERPLVFANNDRPGIMLASAVQGYLGRYGVRPGRRAVVATNNNSAYAAAFAAQDSGIEIAAIIDARTAVPDYLVEEARRRSMQIIPGHAVSAASGGRHVSGVEVKDLAAPHRAVRRFRADLVMISGGWQPAVHLFSQAMGKLRFDEELAAFVPGRPGQPHQFSAGACTGALTLKACLQTGWQAGSAATRACGFDLDANATSDALHADPEPAPDLQPLWAPPGRGGGKSFVDWQADVTTADIELAAREGLLSVEHVKRYTATGMGTDQGKLSNVNALAILAGIRGEAIADVGTTTFRPPYTPVGFGVMAGRELGELSDPVRTTAIHPWHEAHGAVFEDVGQWKRPWYYPQAGETMQAAVNRECLAVRGAVGVMDASTLGKIELHGPGVAEFLDRIYTNAWKKLGIGHCRYGLMCGEDGMVFDDGVTARLGQQHYFMTTTTGGAARVLDWLEEYLQTEWPGLQVYCTSVTEHWATISIAGPKARDVMANLAPDGDWSSASFPFMTVQEHVIRGVGARVFRIGFSGELTFEINVPSHYGKAMWTAVLAAGEPFGITPYGTEAMHVLRAEKGFIIAGQDTDGTVTPQDLGMDWVVSGTKPDFIGKRSFSRPDTARGDRRQLVGLISVDGRTVLEEGAQIIEMNAGMTPPVPMIGHVTSAYFSAALGHPIALALVTNGHDRMGDRVQAWWNGKAHAVRITGPVFYDRLGERRDG